MMRLPPFAYHAPTSVNDVVNILASEGPRARVVAGGTDLFPNMKRRHQTPGVVVSLRGVSDIRQIHVERDGATTLGAAATLRTLERDNNFCQQLPALATAVRSISTPLLRTMGTIGGNVCLDTRCNYYNQNYEWRRAINFCMKCEGDTCWVAPSSPRCWAVNSSDTVPVFMALGAEVTLVGPEGERTIPMDALFQDDGINYLAKRDDEVLTAIRIPSQGNMRSVYRKVRRRGSFDFPVAAVAVRAELARDAKAPEVQSLDIVLNAVGSTPVRCDEATKEFIGTKLTDDAVEAIASSAWRPAKPLDNTDHTHSWRKKMIKVEIRRALTAIRNAR